MAMMASGIVNSLRMFLNYSWFLNDINEKKRYLRKTKETNVKNADYTLSLSQRAAYLFFKNMLADSISLLSSVRRKSLQTLQDFGKSTSFRYKVVSIHKVDAMQIEVVSRHNQSRLI